MPSACALNLILFPYKDAFVSSLIATLVIRDTEEVSGLGWILCQRGAISVGSSDPSPVVGVEAVKQFQAGQLGRYLRQRGSRRARTPQFSIMLIKRHSRPL